MKMAFMAVFQVVLLTAAPPEHPALAGGSLVKVDGREALLRSGELFVNREAISKIEVIISPDGYEEAKRKFGGHLSFAGVGLRSGGPSWSEQLAAAAAGIDAQATHVVIHDAARPIVPFSDIDALLEAAQEHPAVALTTPIRGSLLEVDDSSNPAAYRSSDRFVELLTPQVYRRDLFEQLARSPDSAVPADQLHLLKGSPLNLRVGGSGDAALAKTLLKHLPKKNVKRPTNPFEEAQW